MNTIIRIDETLPNYIDLVASLSGLYTVENIPEENPNSYLELRYSHSENTLAKLSPLNDFNQACTNGKQVKTIFFSWYSWRWHPNKFSEFYNAENEHFFLKKKGLCDHIQLPVSIEDVEQKIKNLLAQK